MGYWLYSPVRFFSFPSSSLFSDEDHSPFSQVSGGAIDDQDPPLFFREESRDGPLFPFFFTIFPHVVGFFSPPPSVRNPLFLPPPVSLELCNFPLGVMKTFLFSFESHFSFFFDSIGRRPGFLSLAMKKSLLLLLPPLFFRRYSGEAHRIL